MQPYLITISRPAIQGLGRAFQSNFLFPTNPSFGRADPVGSTTATTKKFGSCRGSVLLPWVFVQLPHTRSTVSRIATNS